MARARGVDMKYRQQGDVLIKDSKIPKQAKPIKGNILQHGELTGHAHRLFDGEYQIFETPEKEMYLKLVTPTALRHEEHHEILLPPGEYKIGIIREYDPFEKLERRVID